MTIEVYYQLKRKVGKQYVYGYTLLFEGRKLTGKHREPALLPSLPLDALLRGLQSKCRKGSIKTNNKCMQFFGDKFYHFKTAMEFDE